jgi:polyisoprenoid-binding protein YceI
MRKSFLFAGIFAATIFSASLTSCSGGNKAGDAEEVATAGDESLTFLVETTESELGWIGKKLAGQHNGTITISEGSIFVENGILTAGEFQIDMSTIKVLDIADAEQNSNLVAHLSSDDFFGVATHPTSKFEITSTEKLESPDENGNNYIVKGNLTIKNITKNISFPAYITIDSNILKAKAKLAIDRSDFDVRFGSKTFFENIGDKVINDEIELDLNLTAKAQENQG